MDMVSLFVAIIGSVASAFGIVVSVYTIRNLRKKLGQNPANPADGSDRSVIVTPTLDEVIRFGGNAAIYNNAKEEEERLEKWTFHSYPFFLWLWFGLYIIWLFKIPLRLDIVLEPRWINTLRLVRIALQTSSIVWSLCVVALLMFAASTSGPSILPLIGLGCFVSPLIPLGWAALLRSLMKC